MPFFGNGIMKETRLDGEKVEDMDPAAENLKSLRRSHEFKKLIDIFLWRGEVAIEWQGIFWYHIECLYGLPCRVISGDGLRDEA